MTSGGTDPWEAASTRGSSGIQVLEFSILNLGLVQVPGRLSGLALRFRIVWMELVQEGIRAAPEHAIDQRHEFFGSGGLRMSFTGEFDEFQGLIAFFTPGDQDFQGLGLIGLKFLREEVRLRKSLKSGKKRILLSVILSVSSTTYSR